MPIRSLLCSAAAALAFGVAQNAKAEVHAQFAIAIRAPMATIWSLVTDVDRWPDWNPAVQAARLNGPAAKDKAFVWRSQGFEIHSIFQEVTPMAKVAWSGETFGTSAVHIWTFRPSGAEVIVATEETLGGWLPALTPKSMRKRLDETLLEALRSLKAAAEKGQPED